VQVPYGPQWAEPLAKGNCFVVRRVGRKPEAKVGLDEQKSDKRPASWDKAAIDAEVQYSLRHGEGKSGEARWNA